MLWSILMLASVLYGRQSTPILTVINPGIFRIDYDLTQLTLLYLSYSFDKRFKHLIDDLRLICI